MIESPLPTTVVLLEPDGDAAELARTALAADDTARVLATTAHLSSLLEEVKRARPDVVVLDLAAIEEDVGTTVRELLGRAPECCVIVTGADTPPSVVSRAVTAGARGFLLKPYQPTDLRQTVLEAHHGLTELRRLQRAEPPAHAGPTRGAIVVVYSPKGGVGCTTIATSVAIALAGAKRRVALVDLDLQFGDVGCVLDLRSANSIVDLLGHGDSLDANVISDVLAKHTSGVRALLAPETLTQLETVAPDQVSGAVDELRRHFDYIVCDLWSSLDELTLAMLRLADRILLVTTPELPALKNLRRAINSTGNLLLDDRTLIVVNRMPAKVGVGAADIERNIGRPIAAQVPSEGIGVTDAINQGLSLFDHRARVRSTRAYRRIAQLIARDLPHRRPVPQVVQPAATLKAG